MFPQTTRLRWVSATKPETIQAFCDSLGKRIEIKQITFASGSWYLWFVPDDKTATDIPSGKLKDKKNG